MSIETLIPKDSILFAPMEGVTDDAYRQAMFNIYPEWDRFSTDFLRVPSEGHYPEQKIINHFGKDLINNNLHRKKTTYQILTSPRANTEYTVSQINGLGFNHLDLNLGCPSKVVNKNKGGAYLLSDPLLLADTLKKIRSNFDGHFTVKIRTGYLNTDLFSEVIHILQEEGAEAITLHARTKIQAYKGLADWSFIKRAVEVSKVPIIGNGDIWTVEDLIRMKQQTGCHAVMLGRGALKTPWFSVLNKRFIDMGKLYSEPELMMERINQIQTYFDELDRFYKIKSLESDKILKRFKSLSHYIFDDFVDRPEIKSKVLRTKTLSQFIQLVFNINLI